MATKKEWRGRPRVGPPTRSGRLAAAGCGKGTPGAGAVRIGHAGAEVVDRDRASLEDLERRVAEARDHRDVRRPAGGDDDPVDVDRVLLPVEHGVDPRARMTGPDRLGLAAEGRAVDPDEVVVGLR